MEGLIPYRTIMLLSRCSSGSRWSCLNRLLGFSSNTSFLGGLDLGYQKSSFHVCCVQLPTHLGKNAGNLFSASVLENNLVLTKNIISPLIVPVRGFKDKDVLRLRCKDCYFKKIDDRWYVFCNSYGRHKQRQKLPDPRSYWIITHMTHGPRKKF
ncbi:uncharacterized protein LOC106474148 [Limulus polyphemus]|uniref:Large ribosomal subunit protein bL36m n=1 Tax=Limulus polyphemus TaxID=6850 RepID=A0ABM1TQR8_LIMPO|nr:uncharacterized protein LOC106474148 [Limulus polyphemus]